MHFTKIVYVISVLLFSINIGCDNLNEKSERSETQSATSENEPNPEANEDDASPSGPSQYTQAHLYLVHAFDTDDEKLFSKAGSLGLADEEKEDPTAAAFNKQVFAKMLDILFKIADTDKSETISLEEFTAFRLSDLPMEDEAKARIKKWREEAFAKADENGDGSLDKSEAKALLKLSRKHVMQFRKAQGGFAGLIAKFHKAMLDKYDIDKDGKLSEDERKKMRESLRVVAQKIHADLKEQCEGISEEELKTNIICSYYHKVKKFCQEGDDKALPILATLFSPERQDIFCRKYFPNGKLDVEETTPQE